jgi:hypothetical protein
MANEEPDSNPKSQTAPPTAADRIGLCQRCGHVRIQSTKRGSVFYRCGLADEDDSYLRYPALPLRQCRGFELETVSAARTPTNR